MPIIPVALLGLLLLAGCEDKPDPAPGTDTTEHRRAEGDTSEPLATQTHTLEKTPPDCQGGHCPEVRASWVTLENRPALNQAIEAALAGMLASGKRGVDGRSPAELADAFLDDAAAVPMANQQGWRLSADARVQGRHGPLITLALESHEYTGGAHGVPAVGYLHWHSQRQQAVTLADLLVDGQAEAFWALARQRHQQWLDSHDLDTGFRDSWPFQRTDQAYFNDRGLVLHYNVYEIAPYAMGQPTLTLPYDKLDGLVQPAFLPNG